MMLSPREQCLGGQVDELRLMTLAARGHLGDFQEFCETFSRLGEVVWGEPGLLQSGI